MMDLSSTVQRMVGRGNKWTTAKRRKLQEAFQARASGDTLAEGLARNALPINTKQYNKYLLAQVTAAAVCMHAPAVFATHWHVHCGWPVRSYACSAER